MLAQKRCSREAQKRAAPVTAVEARGMEAAEAAIFPVAGMCLGAAGAAAAAVVAAVAAAAAAAAAAARAAAEAAGSVPPGDPGAQVDLRCRLVPFRPVQQIASRNRHEHLHRAVCRCADGHECSPLPCVST